MSENNKKVNLPDGADGDKKGEAPGDEASGSAGAGGSNKSHNSVRFTAEQLKDLHEKLSICIAENFNMGAELVRLNMLITEVKRMLLNTIYYPGDELNREIILVLYGLRESLIDSKEFLESMDVIFAETRDLQADETSSLDDED